MTRPAAPPRVTHLLPGLWAPTAGVPDTIQSPWVQRLARWLGRARADGTIETAAGWEAALAERLGYRQPDGGHRTWLAQPVQLTPGMKDLVAHPVDAVADAEREALWSAAEPELEAADASLRLAEDGLWELQLEAEGRAGGPPPSMGLGRSMVAPSLEGELARRLQVLGNGLQMAWFQHPVNLEREREGRGGVHGLWLWSPGCASEATSVRRVCGGGAIARWLAQGADVDWKADPAAAPATDGDTVVVVDALAAPPSYERRLEILESVAEDVVAPKVRSLMRGGLATLEFVDTQAGDGVGQSETARVLERRDTLAFWRRPRRP